MASFLGLFRHTASLLLPGKDREGKGKEKERREMTEAMILLLDIYFDFTCQDLPPALEDSHEEFFTPETGWFLNFLGSAVGEDVRLFSCSASPPPPVFLVLREC